MQTKMKNTITKYFTKDSNNQLKSKVDLKKHIIAENLCESAMKELKKIYWYEKQLLIAIPILYRNASTFALVESLSLISEYTKEHVKLLEKQFPQIKQLTSSEETYIPVYFKDVVWLKKHWKTLGTYIINDIDNKKLGWFLVCLK